MTQALYAHMNKKKKDSGGLSQCVLGILFVIQPKTEQQGDRSLFSWTRQKGLLEVIYIRGLKCQ
jgi:hypothetical protein